MGKHTLKVDAGIFESLLDGSKTFEFRKDDREPRFAIGDELTLMEWAPSPKFPGGCETERAVVRDVTYVLRGPAYGVPEGYCVMAIKEPEDFMPCKCEGCPRMCPRSHVAGLCLPCFREDCDHENEDGADEAREAGR